MIQQSTAIVRGRIAGSFVEPYGPMIYTHYKVQVTEPWKGAAAASLDVVVPGGASGGLRQTFSGAPKPVEGAEYILFLWKGRNGLTHIIGLSQGLLNLGWDASGNLVASRAASAEIMLDRSGRVVHDQPFSMRLNDLRQRVTAGALGGNR